MLLIVTCKLLTLTLDEDQQYVSWNVEIITFDGLTLHCEMNDQICHLFKWRNDFQRWTALEEIIEWCLTKFKPVPTRYYLNVNTNWVTKPHVESKANLIVTNSLMRRKNQFVANAQNVRSGNSLLWPIFIIDSVD